MCKILMSACIMCMFVTMTINDVTARGRISNSAQSSVGIELKASNPDGLLEQRILLESKLSLNQNIQRFDYNLQGLRLLCCNSTSSLGQFNLKQIGLEDRIAELGVTALETIKVIELPKLKSLTKLLGARSLLDLGASPHIRQEGVLEQL